MLSLNDFKKYGILTVICGLKSTEMILSIKFGIWMLGEVIDEVIEL